jgi:quercetin dioxygenase-like cupin family protein
MLARLTATAAALLCAGLVGATAATAQLQPTQPPSGEKQMQIARRANLQVVIGPAEYFTGRSTITGQFQRQDSARVSGAIVHFEPGARTAWHTHPLGQTLIVIERVGWTQIEGGAVHEFYAGDILWCPPEHKYWHGVTPTSAMTHIAIQESLNGSPVTWMEHVTHQEYLAGSTNDKEQ